MISNNSSVLPVSSIRRGAVPHAMPALTLIVSSPDVEEQFAQIVVKSREHGSYSLLCSFVA